MKELKFEPEILAKHLARNPNSILTGRSKPKGKIGELFRIPNYGVWELIFIGQSCSIGTYANAYSKLEGFSTPTELSIILRRLYDNADIYPHIFNRVQTEEESKQQNLGEWIK